MNGCVGIALLCAAGGLIGCGCGLKLKAVEDDIAEFSALLDYIRWETQYKRKPLPEIFRDFACKKRQREFLDSVSGAGFRFSAFDETLRKFYPALDAEEREACGKISLLFDGRDIDSQLEIIENVRSEVENVLRRRHGENRRLVPMFRSLGFVLGALAGFLAL